ncbi:MAG: hypothetical protein ACREL4_06245 [Gemmatimonadales bacterium]
MHLRSLIRSAVGLGVMLATTGCLVARLSNVWRDPTEPARPLTNVLVVSMARSQGIRRIWEDGIASALQAHGVTVTPSYTVYPGDLPDLDAMDATIHSRGFDGIVLTHPAEIDTQVTVIQGKTVVRKERVYNKWSGHYVTVRREVRQPDSVVLDRSVQIDVDVWMVADSIQMIWTATTRTVNPSSITASKQAIVKAIVPRLAKEGVIPPEVKK